MKTRKLVRLHTQNTTRVKAVDFHPQKSVFIVGLHNGIIQAWDYNSTSCIYEFVDHESSVRSVRFHPLGDFFVSGGDDKKIRMWNYTNRKLLKCFKGHTDFVRSVDFHPTKPWIISSSDDQTIKIWNFMTGKCLVSATGHSHYVMASCFLDEVTILSASLDNTIRVWDCTNLIEMNKSKFVPDVLVKQILNGHDKGINFIRTFLNDNIILSGGDDKEVKLWEYNKELVEISRFYAHERGVTSGIKYKEFICTVGEDGLFVIHNMETNKHEKYQRDNRYWCVAGRDGIFICGHDSGFDIFEYVIPCILIKKDEGCCYIKDTSLYYTNLKTENKICKVERDVVSLQTLYEYILVQYDKRYEVYIQEERIIKGKGNAILMDIAMSSEKEGADTNSSNILIVEKIERKMTVKDLNKNILKEIQVADGKLLQGYGNICFISKGTNLLRIKVSLEKTEQISNITENVNVGFEVERVFYSGKYLAFMSKKAIAIYDTNLNLINVEYEITNIQGGFFHEDVFLYSTTRHVKYIFEVSGILQSVDELLMPFLYKDDSIYYMCDCTIMSMETDLTEIYFKKSVLENNFTDKMLEENLLPGLSPLSFLIKQQKGDLALPYISNKRQRFDLFLSKKNFDECLNICATLEDDTLYEKLGEEALACGDFCIAEKCLLYLKEWYNLFLLYICSGMEDKCTSLYGICDKGTEDIIRMYMEDTLYFFPEYATDGVVNLSVSELESLFNKGYDKVTKGSFGKALETFTEAMDLLKAEISKDVSKMDTYTKHRQILGAYLSGVKAHVIRRKEEDPYKQIVLSKYFSNLPLREAHKKQALLEYINVSYKNQNYKTAREQAKLFRQSDSKIIKKALDTQKDDSYIISGDIFCFDILDYSEFGYECNFCFVVRSKQGTCEICNSEVN